MAIRQIRVEGDEVLRKKSKEVKVFDEALSELIDDMFETMYEANGVGLAAPQVGILKRIFVVDIGEGQLNVLTQLSFLQTVNNLVKKDVLVFQENGQMFADQIM